MQFGHQPKLLTEQEFKQLVKEYLASEPPEQIREQVEKLEMDLASPGDWEAAKHTQVPEAE